MTRSLALAVAAVSLLHACGPAPRRNLTNDEKAADLYWVYSQFGNNYAPIEYKQSLHGFDYEALKAQYLEESKKTATNEEFYDLLYRFVAEFKDAHTSASINNSDLPGRTRVAYLGFSGVRQGDKLVVSELLPSMGEGEGYPIAVGTSILKLDGESLADVVNKQMVTRRNLGDSEANLTYHMNKIFNRLSTYGRMPEKDTAVLTIKTEDGKEKEVILPWIVKDLRTFRMEQEKAKAVKDAAEKEESKETLVVEPSKPAKKTLTESINSIADVYDALGANGETLFQLSFVGFDGRVSQAFKNMLRFRVENRVDRYLNNFTFVDNISRWTTKVNAKGATPADLLKAERTVPEKAIFLSAAKIFPTYVTRKQVLDANGKATSESKLIAVMRLDTFSPDSDPVEEVKATLTQMNELGVKDLLIDMVNNGGGSLELGLKLAQIFSAKKVELPLIQMAVNETWLDDFETLSLNANVNDYKRELARRTFVTLKGELDNGKRISRPIPIDALFQAAEVDTETKKYNIVLLVNEMCASMCDIFSGVMQDNAMAVVAGTKSMGAGGNVVAHYSAPNSQLTLQQTESLMLRKDGSYVENNGVKPDVKINVAESASSKYEPAIEEALKILRKMN